MVHIKIWHEEEFPTKYYVTKHLKLQVTQGMMDIKEDLLQWFSTFLTKRVIVTSNQQLANEFYKPIIKKNSKTLSTFIFY